MVISVALIQQLANFVVTLKASINHWNDGYMKVLYYVRIVRVSAGVGIDRYHFHWPLTQVSLQYSFKHLRHLSVINCYVLWQKNYLEHNVTDVKNTLRDGLPSTGNGDGPFGGVWQHFAGNLNRGTCYFSDFFDLRSALADQWTALTGRHYQPKGDRWPRHATVWIVLELGRTPLRAWRTRV